MQYVQPPILVCAELDAAVFVCASSDPCMYGIGEALVVAAWVLVSGELDGPVCRHWLLARAAHPCMCRSERLYMNAANIQDPM